MLEGVLSNKLIGAYFEVYNTLGYGFLEKVYENALYQELLRLNLQVRTQQPIQVFYKNKKVGQYFADLVVENKFIIELKAAETLCHEHEVQLMNYLKATPIEIGFLFNFGKTAQFKRKYFDNITKKSLKSVSFV